jgi:rhodanese-related sulfurtransferase
MKKTVLFLLSTALPLCVLGLLWLQIVYASPYKNIDVATAYNMITNGSYPDLVVLDVRTKSEYESGHIHGAVWIPHTELEARINELAGHENHEIIVYCRTGVRSEIASDILDSHNFTKVYNMLGGIQAWQSAGYPVSIPEKEEVPFWVGWWFWTVVATGIVVSAGAVYFLKKRKPPTPTAPPPSEGAR